MALDPTLDPYALAVVAASGLTAAGMHAVALASGTAPWPPRRQLTANLISTALVGFVMGEAARHVPLKLDLIPVLLIAAIAGHVLGPRGVRWVWDALLAAAQKLPWMPALPPTPTDPPAEPTKEVAEDA